SVDADEALECGEGDDRVEPRHALLAGERASDGHPAHEGRRHPAHGGGGRAEREKKEAGPDELEKQSGESAQEERGEKKDASRRHAGSYAETDRAGNGELERSLGEHIVVVLEVDDAPRVLR